MKYTKVVNANNMVRRSNYVINNPKSIKGRWNEVFKNNNPIYIELGMGRGEYILEMAKHHPEINYIGIELDESQISFAVKKLNFINLPNVRLLLMDASKIAEVFSKEIDRIYITFPEPWPKDIDIKKRFTNITYLRLYDQIYRKDKHLILKTDNKDYYIYSLEQLSQYWYQFKKISFDLHHEDIENYMTEFEKEYYKLKRPIYYVEAIYK
jgi:tRNA (guanine-N7-)-methyltransferase